MSVVMIENARPAVRSDSVAWTQATVQRTVVSPAEWEDVHVFALAPLDVDPEDPASRDFTFQGSGADLQYRIIWTDATGATSTGPAITANPSLLPDRLFDVDMLRERSRLTLDLYSDEQLDVEVQAAIGYVELVTGRYPLSDVPAQLVRVAQMAVRMRVEQQLLTGASEAVIAQVNPGGVVSFSVPGYSETRSAGGGSSSSTVRVNTWGALDELLWLLMTPERRAELTAEQNGTYLPALAFAELESNYDPHYDGWPY